MGAFPLQFREKSVFISKFGLLTNALSILFLTYEITKLSLKMMRKQQDATASSDINIILEIINLIFLLIIFIRRPINVNREVNILSELFESISGKYKEIAFVLLIQSCDIIIECGLFVYFRMTRDNFVHTHLILIIRVGFESLIVMILASVEELYRQLNNSIRTTLMNNSLSVLCFRIKYENLHSLRLNLNDIYSLDLLLYFSSSQLWILLVCFNMTKQFSSQGEGEIRTVLEFLRFARLFTIMSYIIWRWHKVSEEVSKK
ncbi:hypothetical protein PGB90_003537 [Kerria lacca]